MQPVTDQAFVFGTAPGHIWVEIDIEDLVAEQ